MCLNNLSKVALDSAATGIEHAISSRKSNADALYKFTYLLTYPSGRSYMAR